MNRSNSSSRGLTLVELLLASSLATMLMVGVLAVLTNLAIADQAVGSLGSGAKLSQDLGLEELDAWAQMLAQDLQQAGRIERLMTGEVELLTYQALQGAARQVGHRPVRVGYLLQEIDGRRWVLRQQVALDAADKGYRQRDLVARGVWRFELVPQSLRPAASAQGSAGGRSPTPSVGGTAVVIGLAGATAADAVAPSLVDIPGYRDSWHRLDGQWLCIVNTPPWIAALRPDAPGVASPGLGGLAADGPPPTAADSWMETFRQVIPPGGHVWRLRVWTDTSNLPSHERILTIR